MSTNHSNLQKQNLTKNYKKTRDLMTLISSSEHYSNRDEVDKMLIEEINKTDNETLEQDISSYLKITDPNFGYINLPHTLYPNILSQVLHTQSEKVIHALLDKDLENESFYPFYYLLKRANTMNLSSVIEITQKFVESGLDINASQDAKKIIYGPLGDPSTSHIKMNYFSSLMTCCIEKKVITDEDEEFEDEKIEFNLKDNATFLLNYVIAQGFEAPEDKGELIKLAIDFENKELIDIVCSIKGIDSNYIEKGINLWQKEYDSDSWQHSEEYDNSEIIDYIKKSFEKALLDKALKVKPWVKPQKVKEQKKKLKI
jgi:hypothetical protein